MWVRSISLRLLAARGLEQTRIDDKAHRKYAAEHLVGCRRQSVLKRLLQPFLEMAIRYAYRQLMVVPGKSCMPVEPKPIARLADAANQGLLKRSGEFAFTDSRRFPQGAHLFPKVGE
jgi:hypothetical protein